jgi:outer membrane receptor for ferrienterochelin and colicins
VTAFVNQDVYSGDFILGNIPGSSNDQTYNVDFTDTRVAGGDHYLTYGGNFRQNVYDNVLVPNAKDRTSVGAFLQDDFFITDLARMVVGVRWDYVDPMGSAFSPRASLMIEPWHRQRFRFTYNRAFQAPTILQNYAEIPNLLQITFPDFNNPGSGDVVTVPIFAVSRGNTSLEPKQLDAFEIGWSTRLGDRVALDVTGYWNEFRNAFQFVVSETYTADNPPANWPFDPALLDGPLANTIPAAFLVENLGKSTERGVEVGTEVLLGRDWTAFGNYSWQDVPELEGYAPVPMPDGSERMPINIAPRHRFNLGLAFAAPRFFANGTVSHQGDAFWTDVLDSRAWGPTTAFTTVNATAGVRFPRQNLVVSVTAMNLFDTKMQQHVWGDFIDRRIIGQLTYRF